MAYYNTGFQYQNPYQQQVMNQQQQLMAQQAQTQSSGLINVPNEAFAFNYPVAPGNSVMFKDESLPLVYVKTMGLSQFDQPTFEKYRLVKEDASAPQPVQDNVEYALKSDLEEIKAEINNLKDSITKGE